MGSKLLWSGVTCILALTQLFSGLPWEVLGALLMLVGIVLLWLDK